MSTNPTSKNASFAALQAHHTLAGVNQRYTRMQIACGTTIPPVGVIELATNPPPSLSTTTAIFWPRNTAMDVAYMFEFVNGIAAVSTTAAIGYGFFLFRDNTDGNGAGTGRVKFYNFEAIDESSKTYLGETSYRPDSPTPGLSWLSGTIQILAADFSQPGTYKLVPVFWYLTDGTALESDAQPPTTGRVSNGTNEFYVDADGMLNAASGPGDLPAVNTFDFGRVAWIRVASDVQSIEPSSPSTNQGYGSTPNIVYDLTSGTLNNPKQIRVGPITPGSAVTVAQTKIITQTPVVSGTRPSVATYNVDTSFSASSIAHTNRIYVGPRGGQSSTPSGEIPDLLSAGTLVLPDTNDKAWVCFNTGSLGSGITFKDSYTVERSATFNIGSGIFPKKDSSGSLSGVGSFRTSAYTTAQDIFRRTAPTVTTDAVVHLETYVFNAFSSSIANTSFQETVRLQTTDAAINTQTVSTDANGRIRWNYTIPNTAPAFSRYVKDGATRQSGSHVATGPDSISNPPATFVSGNSDHVIDYPSPYPGYPRRVKITGNVYSGTLEPSSVHDNVFGVNSEIIFEDIWTGTATAAALDGSGVPTGAGQRLQTLGAGSLKAKLTTFISESNVTIAVVGEHNPKDVAGRNLVVTTDNLFLRRALFDDTLDTVSDSGTSLSDASTKLDNSLGYHVNANSLDTIAAPADPASLIYYLAAADTSTQRGTFSLTLAGASPSAGFTSDVSNFGFLQQNVSFIAFDPSVKILVNSDVVQTDPTIVRRFTVKVLRITADEDAIDLTPDAAPFFFVYSQPLTGAMIELTRGTATVIGAPPSADWEFNVTMPLNIKSIKVVVFAKVGGSLIVGGSEINVQVGFEFDALGTFIGFQFK